MRLVKNIETGQVIHWNKYLVMDENIVPYKTEQELKEVAEDDAGGLLSKKEAGKVIVKIFGRDITKVTNKDLIDYFDDNHFALPCTNPSKRELATTLKNCWEDR